MLKRNYIKILVFVLGALIGSAVSWRVIYLINHSESNQWDGNTPIVTFVDDDARESLLTQYYPILDKYHIKGCASAIMGTQEMAGYATKEQLLLLQAKGWDILNHSCDIDALSDTNDKEKIDYAITLAREGGYKAAKRIFVYPNGASDTEIQAYAAKYFNYAFGTDSNANTINNYNKMNCARLFISNELSTQDYEKQIDEFLQNQTWLIISTHSGEDGGLQNFEPVLKYVIEKKAVVMTATEAIEAIEQNY